MLPILILPAAESDLRSAMAHYDEVRSGYGELFRLEIDRTLGLIRRWPSGYEQVSPTLRRAVVHRFPYAVVYRVLPDQVRVVGVVPTRRDPAQYSALDDPSQHQSMDNQLLLHPE